MKDAFGGILNLVFIVVFLLVVIGVLGLVVSYTKAFKMKNAIISTIESYEGSGCADSSNDNTECKLKIKEAAEKLAFSPTNMSCDVSNEYYNAMGLYCYKIDSEGLGAKRAVFKIVTQVDINLPIINRIMGLSVFQVSGDTRVITLQY